MALYPHDLASARCAAELLEQHLLEHREFERRMALSPIEACQEKLAGMWLLLLRPALAPRRRRKTVRRGAAPAGDPQLW
jgi:hypothetical protein